MRRLLMLTIVLFFVFVELSGGTENEELKYYCFRCKKVITKTALVIEGKLYHPECFICKLCEKPIEGEYLKDKENKYYHPACLEKLQNPICDFCDEQIIGGKYIAFEGKAYHPDCYTKNIAPRCDICGEALASNYITDYWGNSFHPRHTDEFPVCAVCGRLVWHDEKIQLDEQNWLCHICAEQSVRDPEHARRLLEEIRSELASMGIVVTSLGIRIEMVESSVLSEGREPDKLSHTFANIQWRTGETWDGEALANIKLLRLLPEDFMKGIIAHELMHAWQHENGADGLSLDMLEGSANWTSSLIYSRMRSERGQFFLDGLRKSRDPIYGEGFRTVNAYADRYGVEGVLKMLEREGSKRE